MYDAHYIYVCVCVCVKLQVSNKFVLRILQYGFMRIN